MQVIRTQSNNYNNQPNFKALIVTEKGAKALSKAFNPKQLEQITKWGKELKNTKHFDLEIDAVVNDLFYTFNHKTNSRLSSEAPLHPVSIKENALNACGVDLLDCGDWFYYNNLKFPTEQDACKAYATLSLYKKTCTPYFHNVFKRLEWAVESTKILDKSFEYMKQNPFVLMGYNKHSFLKPQSVTEQFKQTTEKPSILQRLKNAWQALKGN